MSSSDRCSRPSTPQEPAVVISRLRNESTQIKREELDKAVRKLEDSGDLSEHDRVVLEEMADRIVTQLLKPPILALEERENADPAELEVLSRLFEQWTDRDSSE